MTDFLAGKAQSQFFLLFPPGASLCSADTGSVLESYSAQDDQNINVGPPASLLSGSLESDEKSETN